jgi:sigma-B regulation protein RsbU (phosphoserine phosphatase)
MGIQSKQIKIKTTLGAKLFFYMSLLVIVTICGLSAQFYRSFKIFQTSQVQDSLQIQAEKASSSLEGILDTWRTNIAANLTTFRTSDGAFDLNKVQAFLESNQDFVFFDIANYSKDSKDGLKSLLSATTKRSIDERFEGKKLTDVIKTIQEYVYNSPFQSKVNSVNQNIFVTNISQITHLPIFIFSIRFDIDKTSKSIFVFLGAWHSEIVKNLPKSKFVDSYVLEEKSKIFTSTNTKHLEKKSMISSSVLSHLKQKETQPSGYIDEFKTIDMRRRVGAFSRSPKYKLAVVIEQDVEFAYEQTQRNIFNIGLWAILFILFAVLLSYLGASSITKGLREVTTATQKIAGGDFKYRINPTTTDEVAALSHSINDMSTRILNLLNSQIERVRYEKELETAKMVQSTFFPKRDIEGEYSRITGFYKPASECGGDLWAHFRISDKIEYIFIGDAMGHGAPAALVTAMAYSIFMATLDIFRRGHGQLIEPYEILAQLNSIIFEAVESTISMTAFIGMLDYTKNELVYSNAAHNFPILISQTADDSRFSSKKKVAGNKSYAHTTLTLTGPLLGVEANQTYNQKSIPLHPGDRIALYTDGLIECRSPKGSAYGKRKFLDTLLSSANLDASGMKNSIINSAFKHFDKEPLADDTTLVIVEIKNNLPSIFESTPPTYRAIKDSLKYEPSSNDSVLHQNAYQTLPFENNSIPDFPPVEFPRLNENPRENLSPLSRNESPLPQQGQSLLDKLRARRKKAS